MPVNFAAVHERKPWRKHRQHQSLYAAIDGKDGAKNLLRRAGRASDMWLKYGDVHCVFVWEDNTKQGQAFRKAPDSESRIETINVPIEKILELDKRKTCSAQEIANCFTNDTTHPVATPKTLPAQQKTAESNQSLYPDEISGKHGLAEGLAQQVLVNRFERSTEARNACIAHYGSVCQACKFDFEERYGQLGAGFIHVHHRVPISQIGEQYRVNPIRDLIPVCPNCHAMIHRQDPPLDLDDLRRILNRK